MTDNSPPFKSELRPECLECRHIVEVLEHKFQCVNPDCSKDKVTKEEVKY